MNWVFLMRGGTLFISSLSGPSSSLAPAFVRGLCQSNSIRMVLLYNANSAITQALILWLRFPTHLEKNEWEGAIF